MISILKRLRPLLIGLVALLFTAGIAFAGKPSVPANGLTVASEASGKVVPVQADEGDEDGQENVESDEDAEAPEAPEVETEAAGDNCATDPTALSEEDLAALRHGSVVCWAAHQETPEGYANHGAWVSEWAKKNHGHQDLTTDETGSVLPAAATSHGNGKGKSNH